MALPEYSVANFRMLGIMGPPNTAHPRSEIITRPGLRGGEIWRTKRIPVPFTLRTAVDAKNTLHAHQLYRDYQRLSRRETLIQITYRDVLSSAGFGTSYFVMDCQVVAMEDVRAWCGRAINPPSTCLLTVEWLLAPFDDAPGTD